MTRRRILNVTSTKKRDNVLVKGITDDATDETPLGQPYVMTGDNFYGFLWSPSARVNRVEVSEHSRTMSDTYVPGFKERVELETNNGANWQWRRIIFAAKGPELRIAFPIGTLYQHDNENGVQRAVWNFLSGLEIGEEAREPLEDLLFEGQAGKDWIHRFTAKVDNKRVTLLSDSTRKLSSGNDNGRFFTSRRWTPVRKRIVYDDDEDGDDKTLAVWSTVGKPGLGDIYICDYIGCAGGAVTDTLEFTPQCTYYWHER